MTVSGTSSRERYTGNDVTVNFPITFVYGEDADINVTHIDTLGVETPWVLDGVGDTGFTIVSSAVVANTAPENGTDLVIYRVTPLTQETDYVENRATPATVTEDTLDKLTMITQELDDASDRSMRLPVTAEEAVSTVLPLPESLKLIRWDVDAEAFENIDSAEIAGQVMASNFVVDAYVDGVGFTAGVTTELVLTSIPGTENNTQIFFDGVYQEKSGYTLAGSTITFGAAIPGGTTLVEVVYLVGAPPSVPADNSVITVKLANSAVTNAKMAANSVDTPELVALAITFSKLAAALALDEDDMVSDSATALSTQQAAKAYADISNPRRAKFTDNNGATPFTFLVDSARYWFNGTKAEWVYWDAQLTTVAAIPTGGDTPLFLYIDDTAVQARTGMTLNEITDASAPAALIWSETAPVYSQAKGGYYNGDDLCIYWAQSNAGNTAFLLQRHDGGDLVVYDADVAEVTDATPSNVWAPLVLTIPAFCIRAKIGWYVYRVDAGTASSFYRADFSSSAGHFVGVVEAASTANLNTFDCMTDPAQTIEYRWGSATTNNEITIKTSGWYFPRGM